MFRNYIKTAFRSVLRERVNTIINILGLTLGITCSLILFLLVKYDAGFDDFHTKRDRIYRIVQESDGNDRKEYSPGVPPGLPDAFRQDFAEAEEVTFASYYSDALITIPAHNNEPKKFQEEAGVVFAESNFFKIFDRQILQGNAENGLDMPGEAIISKSLALKYFGKEDVLGLIVKQDSIEYKITAVMEDYPPNTDFPFNLMLSYITKKMSREATKWNGTSSNDHCYILIKENETAKEIEARIPAFVNKSIKKNFKHKTFYLQPLSELHFDARFEPFTDRVAPKEMLIALGVVAIFLLITASINFINLSTAEAIKRLKEVGIRKALGSSRSQLVGQFLGETTMITVFSLLISLALTQLMLGFINPFLDLKLSLDFSSDKLLWIYIISVTSVVSTLSGLYPALVISGYKPVHALKNKTNSASSSGFTLRRSLVVFQFMISQFFIIGTIVLISQMNYFQNRDLGFKKDAILIVPVPESTANKSFDKMRTLRNELLNESGIEMASLCYMPPSSGSSRDTGFTLEGENEDQRKNTQVKIADGNYLDLFGLQLIAGRGLSDLDTANGFVVNEQLLKVAGFGKAEDMIGKIIVMWGMKFPVVGVVKDFHTVSLKVPIEPVIMFNGIKGYETLAVKVNPANFQQTIAQIKTKWEVAYPEHFFDYGFLDEHIRDFYEDDQKLSILLTGFTCIAIFIGCLGLFGLAAFMTNQKTKEIGVRKVLGASVESILYRFTKEYVKLILVSFALASPLAWFVMTKYLEDFAYRITLGPGIFLMALSLTLTIATLTVGYKSIRAAIMNPVKALRYE